MRRIWTIAALLASVVTLWSQTPQERKIPFELRNGLVLVKAQINGVEGNFILDTGSPGVVVHPKNVKGLKADYTSAISNGRGLPVKVSHFSWAGEEHRGMEALALDISHLETASDSKILGVIGYDVLKKHELMFDCTNRVLLLYKHRKSWIHEMHPPLLEVPFRMVDGLPIVQLDINGRAYRLGIDTGGSNNLMTAEQEQQLVASLNELKKQQRITNIMGESSYEKVYDIGGITLEGFVFPATPFLFTDLSHLEELQVDGLLGIPFLSRFRFAINYRKQKIYFWNHGPELTQRRI